MMSNILKWYHLNRHHTLPCKHCAGIICHLPCVSIPMSCTPTRSLQNLES